MKNLVVAALMVAFSSFAFAQGSATAPATEQPATVNAPAKDAKTDAAATPADAKKEEKAAKKHKKHK